MRYKTNLILFIILLLGATGAVAQDDRYRVEILVLTHIDHGEEAIERKWLEDYSALLDFLTPPPEEDETDETEEDTEAESSGKTEDQPGTPEQQAGELLAVTAGEDPGLEEASEEDLANAVVQVEEMSEVMQEAWRRLRLSAPFRPEQYLSWEQGRDEPFPVLRLHDLEMVKVDDPYAEQRKALEEEEAARQEDTAAGAERPQGSAADLAEEEDVLPDPSFYYRLDGYVMLKRTRFLHLDIALQLREALFEAETTGLAPTPPVALLEGEEMEPPQPSSFLLHELVQSRQVKTARMEYFDGPVLGVLAYITGISLEEPQD